MDLSWSIGHTREDDSFVITILMSGHGGVGRTYKVKNLTEEYGTSRRIVGSLSSRPRTET